MSDCFRTQLKRGDLLLGTMVTLPTASTAEILADAGFDWLFVDGEHGPLETGDILSILQAVGHRIPCMVRVPAGEESMIKRVLDLGAEGVIVPQVNSAAQAAEVVRFSRYSPQGARGVGLARAHGYGFRFAEYVAEANDRIVVIVQAEHRLAAEQIESIVAVDGVDAVMLGPYDLSASYGLLGQIDAPEVLAGIERICKTSAAAGIPVGYFGVNADAVKPWIARGCTLIATGVDVLFLGSAARRTLHDLQSGQNG